MWQVLLKLPSVTIPLAKVSKLIGAVSNTPSLEGKACCVYLSLLGVAVATMAGEVRLRIAHFVLEHVYTWLPTLESVVRECVLTRLRSEGEGEIARGGGRGM